MTNKFYVRAETTGELHGYYHEELARKVAQLMSEADTSQAYKVYSWQALVRKFFDGDEEATQQAIWESMKSRLADPASTCYNCQ